MAQIWVRVVDAQYQPVAAADVQAFDAGTKSTAERRQRLDVGREADEGLWIVYAPDGSIVDVHVAADNHDTEVVTVRCRDDVNQVVVGLRRDGELSYSYGDNRLAFAPVEKEQIVNAVGHGARSRLERALKRAKLAFRPAVEDSDEGSDEAFLVVEGTVDEVEAVAGKVRNKENEVIVLRVIRHGERPPLGLPNELVVRFNGDIDRAEADRLAASVGLKITRRVEHAGNGFVLSSGGPPSYDVLAAADRLMDSGAVEYVEPNLYHHLELDAYTPNDPLFGQTPHLGLIEVDEAWDLLDDVSTNLRGGSPQIAIAVIDPQGVAPNHPDLTANLTDGSTKLITSMDFLAVPIAAQTVANLAGDHGTQCAGSATAAFDDSRGIAGVAPNCHLIGAKSPVRTNAVAMSDAYMWVAGFLNGSTAAGFPTSLPAQPADVISSSYGSTGLALSNTMRDLFDFLTTYGRDGKGCVVLWSLGNSGYADYTNAAGTNFRAWPTYGRCLGVGSSINVSPTNPLPNTVFADENGSSANVPAAVDTRALYSPFGQTALRKPDFVSPSHTAYIPGGGVYDPITSSVRVGTGTVDGCNVGTCNDYDSSFGGTSHSTPTAAGAVALILSARPSLNWVQVRDIIRESCARIDGAQANAIGQWQDLDGDGAIDYSRWYGAGRLDVAAAVGLALDGTRPLADIYVRENLGDGGDVPSSGSWWASPDIWVRTDPSEPIPALAWGAAPPHQNATGGQDNAVFCRVRNRGAGVATEVHVRAMVTHWAGLEFVYPDDFQPSNNVGAPVPTPLVPGTYLIGDTTITDLAPGADQIVKFTWPAALVPPEDVVVSGATVHWHPCLLLEASPHDGPAPIGGLAVPVQGDNNIAQRNIQITYTDENADAFTGMVIGTRAKVGVATLVIDPTRLDGAKVIRLHLADERLMEQLMASAERAARRRPSRPPFERDLGLVLDERARVRLDVGRSRALLELARGSRIAMVDRRDGFGVSFGRMDGVPVVELSDLQTELELPIRLEAGRFVPLLVSVGGEPAGDLRITQRRGDGELSGGYGITYRDRR